MKLQLLFAALFISFGALSVHAQPQAPFPIQPLGKAKAFQPETWQAIPAASCKSKAEEPAFETATQLAYDADALYMRNVVRDASVQFAPGNVINKHSCDLFKFDSVEFWIGRHQFTVGVANKKGIAYDYTVSREITSAKVEWKQTPEGYEIISRIPWKDLGVATPKAGTAFQFSVWFNNINVVDGKQTRKQYSVPEKINWDSPRTFGATFLNDTIPVGQCASFLEPLFEPEVETRAYMVGNRLLLKPNPKYGALKVRCEVEGGGTLNATLGENTILLDLPLAENPGVRQLKFYADFGGRQFGPVSIDYFANSKEPLRNYRSAKEPPKDFDAFWDKHLAELAKEPLEAKDRIIPRPGDNKAELHEVTLRSWKGVKIVIYLSIPKAPGKYPLSLNVYPASAVKAEDVKSSAGSILLAVNPRGIGASAAYSPKPEQLYVSDNKNPDDFYPLANILDIVRGIDYALTLDKVDKSQVYLSGGSRGGYLTMSLAAADPRITVASATVPCYADVDLMGRLGHGSAASDAYLAIYGGSPERQKNLRRVWEYFDIVNLAHRIKCPIVIEAGMQDTICGAPGIIDAFNRISSTDKYLVINPEHGHSGTEIGGSIRTLWQKLREVTKDSSYAIKK